MKKFLCLVLALVLALSVFVACGKSDNTDDTNKAGEQTPANVEDPIENEDPVESEEPAESIAPAPSKPSKKPDNNIPSAATPAPSTNKEIATEENAPDVYLAIDNKDNATSISYHLKDCKLIKGTDAQKVSWAMVKELGFRQCPKCNPPRYEGYIE